MSNCLYLIYRGFPIIVPEVGGADSNDGVIAFSPKAFTFLPLWFVVVVADFAPVLPFRLYTFDRQAFYD